MPMTLVQTVTVGAGGVSAITFSNIPQNGKDLLLLASARSSTDIETNNSQDAVIRFNGTSLANLSFRRLSGNGSAASSTGSTTSAIYGKNPVSTATANTFGSQSVYITNYASSSAKSFSADSVAPNNTTAAVQDLIAGSWNNSAPITSVRLDCWVGGNLVQGTTMSLYIIS